MESNGSVDNENDQAADPSQSPREQARDAKTVRILEACKWNDIEALRILATTEDGLVADELRRQACLCHQETIHAK